MKHFKPSELESQRCDLSYLSPSSANPVRKLLLRYLKDLISSSEKKKINLGEIGSLLMEQR